MKRLWLMSLLCFSIAFLLCLSIGISSWLETNNLLLSSVAALSEHFSLFKIHLYSVKTNQFFYLTFGLWRYCMIDLQDDTVVCSSARIDFDINATEMTEAINSIDASLLFRMNNLSPLSSTSYTRFVLLLLASLGAVVSLVITAFLIPGKTRRNWQRRVLFRFISLQSLIGATLTSVALAVSLRKYRTDIGSICSNLLINQNGYICQSYTLSTETVLFGISIGLFVLSAIHSVVCSTVQPSIPTPSTFRANNSLSSFFDQNPIVSEKPPISTQIINQSTHDSQMERLESHYSNSTSANNRASLRPPPQRQRSVRVNNNHEPPSTEVGVQNPGQFSSEKENGGIPFPTSNRQSIDITDFNMLIPPTPPFASGRPSFSPDYRPPSYGSSHTFGALQGNYFGTDDSSQTSSCIDRNQKTDSIGASSSHLMYASNSVAMQSNHTLGGNTFLNGPDTNRNSSCLPYHNNSSFSGDEDVIDLYREIDDNSNVRSSIPSSQLISSNNDSLHKRIDDYLQFKGK